jgi:hypothetical protein
MSQYLFRLALSADSSLRIDGDFWLWSLPILSMSHYLFHWNRSSNPTGEERKFPVLSAGSSLLIGQATVTTGHCVLHYRRLLSLRICRARRR